MKVTKHIIVAALGIILGAAFGLLPSHWHYVWTPSGTYVVTPQGNGYIIPEGGSIRYSHGGTCSGLARLTKDNDGEWQLLPGDDNLLCWTVPREIDGLHVTYAIDSGTFRLSHHPVRPEMRIATIDWPSGSSASGEMAVDSLIAGLSREQKDPKLKFRAIKMRLEIIKP